MESNKITESLENKSILITGSTGFLAKIFVEKVLRVHPNVKKLFLVVRAQDTKSALQRLHDEVTGKDLFRVLKQMYGTDFNSFISSKVTPVAGDISCKDFGLVDSDLKEQLWNETEIIVNVAGITKFDARYDVAFGINTLGAKHVGDFAKKCPRLHMLLHVSTAYVCGEKSGIILEKPFEMGETLNGVPGLDTEHELQLVQRKCDELVALGATKKEETAAMKELGLQRARLYGWPNTYVFTKAMGEMLMGELRGTIPLAIIRPTIITSTYKEPFPGWLEGIKTIDGIAVGYAKGKVPFFLGAPDSILDLAPADMVVNSMVVVVTTHSNQSKKFIYQVASSLKNPTTLLSFSDLLYHYFSKNPWLNKEGKHVMVSKVTIFPTPTSFRRYICLHYLFPLKVFQVVNTLLCNYFLYLYTDANEKIEVILRLVHLYKPYVLFKGMFDDLNLESLGISLTSTSERTTYYFDPKIIN